MANEMRTICLNKLFLILFVAVQLFIWINLTHSANHGLDKNDNTVEEVQKSPPAAISMFDDEAYKNALEKKGLNDTLCPTVSALEVRKVNGVHPHAKKYPPV